MNKLAAATVVAALSIAAPAFADAPGTIAPSTVPGTTLDWVQPPRFSPDRYVDLGATVGAYDQFLIGGAVAEGGVRIAGPLWLHASLSSGVAGELFAQGSGTYVRGSAGLELRGCVLRGRFCAIGGGDLGLVHASFDGMDTLFDSGGTVNDTADHTFVMPRIGFDAGDSATRVRWMVEVPLDLGGNDDGGGGGNITLAVAHEW